jgi:hypothetical protein
VDNSKEETIRLSLKNDAAIVLLLLALALPIGMGVVAAIMEEAEHSQPN